MSPCISHSSVWGVVVRPITLKGNNIGKKLKNVTLSMVAILSKMPKMAQFFF